MLRRLVSRVRPCLLPSRPPSASVADRASVALVLSIDDNSKSFSRTITAAGASEYRVDGQVVRATDYEKELGLLNIDTRARNFLVFQGDVSEVANKSPKDLTALFERLSGSDALAQEYDDAVVAKREAEENTISTYQKKKSFQNERKVLKAQRDEAAQYEELDDRRRALRTKAALLRMYQIEEAIGTLEVERQRTLKLHAAAEKRVAEVEAAAKEAKRAAARSGKERIHMDRRTAAANRAVDKLRPKGIRLKSEIAHLDKQVLGPRPARQPLLRGTSPGSRPRDPQLRRSPWRKSPRPTSPSRSRRSPRR